MGIEDSGGYAKRSLKYVCYIVWWYIYSCANVVGKFLIN